AELRLLEDFSELQLPDGIDLALGAPHIDPPAAGCWLPVERRGLPRCGLPELREAVAARLHAEHTLTLSPAEEVLISLGVSGAFQLVRDSLVNAVSRVVLFAPTSPLYVHSLRQRRTRIRWVTPSLEDGRLRIPFDRLAGALRGARLLVIAEPVNPTGGVLA